MKNTLAMKILVCHESPPNEAIFVLGSSTMYMLQIMHRTFSSKCKYSLCVVG